MFSIEFGVFTFKFQSNDFLFFEGVKNNQFQKNSEELTRLVVLIADDSLSAEDVVRISDGRYAYAPRSIKPALQKVMAAEGVQHKISLTMHSAGLSRTAGGILLFGKSGAGKSTTADKLSSYFYTGNSDNNIILFSEKNDDSFLFMSLPFYNRQKQQPKPMEKPVSVQAAFLLEKEFDTHSSVAKIEDKDSVWRFLIDGQVQAPMLQPELFPKYNDMLAEFVDKTDFFLLKHNLNDSADFLYNLIAGVLND